MSDAKPTLRRIIPVQRDLNRERYLQACRDKGATTQEQRARLLEPLSRQAVSRYETNTVEPLVSTAQWIAARLDRTVEDLWGAA